MSTVAPESSFWGSQGALGAPKVSPEGLPRVGGLRGAVKSAAPLHAVAAPSRRVKAERLSSSRAPALYSDSESHYYWDAKIKEIATSRKRATLQHFSSLLGPKPSETQVRLGPPNLAAHSTDPPLGTPEIEGRRPRALPRRSGEQLLRFSALFSHLLCLFSSARPVLAPFWPHFGALGTSKT